MKRSVSRKTNPIRKMEQQATVVEAEWYQYRAGQENNETERSSEINLSSQRNCVFETEGI